MQNTMIRAVLCLSLLLHPAVAGQAWAEEELAPGSDACLERAEDTASVIQCFGAAHKYWDKLLNANYSAVLVNCESGPDPEVCRTHVRTAQRHWIQYRDAMSSAIAEMDGGGSLRRQWAAGFLARETKKQAQLLDPER